MKKTIVLSLACSLWINAAEVELETIQVDTKVDTEVIKDVRGEDLKSADLAEALFKQSPSVALSRRSGIANDIVVRGQRKDNINVTIDGAKVHGACPNRMDPPISHILTNNVDYIEINEGPFNVEDFGALSADVKIHTIKPTEEFEGEVNLGLGSWGYQKGSFSLSGGVTDNVRVLLTGSTEKSGQYEDGDGNTFAEQLDNYIADNLIPGAIPGSPEAMFNMKLNAMAYQDQYRDIDAYSKKTMMAKLFWDITDNQELRLSYTANRSDDILYPSSPMDAMYDDSDIYNMEYIAKDLGTYSKALNFQVYQSEVSHPMSNLYRKSALMMGEKTHALTTKMQGAKLSNSFDIDNHTITAGLDFSKRNWDGKMYADGIFMMNTINDVDTQNVAIYVKDKIKMDKFVLDLGMRYDDTEITSQNPMQQENDYNELNGYVLGTYNADENTKYFTGFGKSSRVPDARELYIMLDGKPVGNPNLDATVNYEFDIGAEKKYENTTVKAKAFYSMLDDFIAYNSTGTVDGHNLENVDATIWGLELSGTYIATDSVYFDYGMSYQRGKKKDPLYGQTDTDMPEIPPFKFNGAVNYDYDETLALRAEVIASNNWTDFDGDNGEQELDSYAVLNLKGTKQFGKHFELTVGVDNVFDTTYAVTNTYTDITLLPVLGGADSNVILMNEPGRYVYTNIKYKF